MLPSTKHPTQRLLFFVAQDVDAAVKNKTNELIQKLSNEKKWLIQPPYFVDAIDQTGTRDEDFPDETIGGILEIYSAVDGSLPGDVDAATLAEVEILVEEIRRLSQTYSLAIEFELDGIFVGAIEDGHLDKSLKEGLLGEWRRHLNAAKK